MNDKPSNQGEGQPSHQAAKVVIPFDIDMSEVESKLAEIERRFEKFNGGNDRPDQITPKSDIADKFDRIVESSSRQPKSDYAASFAAGNAEQSQTEMIATLNRMADLVRQLNDTVLLIYSEISNRNNG
jgi:hypothetical protein